MPFIVADLLEAKLLQDASRRDVVPVDPGGRDHGRTGLGEQPVTHRLSRLGAVPAAPVWRREAVTDLDGAARIWPGERSAIANHQTVECDEPTRARFRKQRHRHGVGSVCVWPSSAYGEFRDLPGNDCERDLASNRLKQET